MTSASRFALAVALAATAACGDNQLRPMIDAAPDAARPDAPPAACGIEEPGSKCLDGNTLARCNGGAVETVDCTASNQVCASDPGMPYGAACVTEGDDCGLIPQIGTCDQNRIFTRCLFGRLDVVDCGAGHGICQFVARLGHYGCTTPCIEANVSAEGMCVGNNPASYIRRCRLFADGYQVVTDACPTGMICTNRNPDSGEPGCLLPSCLTAGVGAQGLCLGDKVSRCVNGAVRITNCADDGRVCGYGGDLVGYVCADPGVMGQFVVAGTIRYEDRPQGLGFLMPPVPAPVRGAAVSLVSDDTAAVLAGAMTGDDGSYTLRYDAVGGTHVHVLVAAASTLPARPTRVVRPDGLVHGFAAPSFGAGTLTNLDVLVTEASGEAEAFNIFDVAVTALDLIRVQFATNTPAPLTQVWGEGGEAGTYTVATTSYFLGWLSDDDGYDDSVIGHELGHTVENVYGATSNPGSIHFIGRPEDPRLAWSEGWATYFSSVVRNNSAYIDTSLMSSFWFDNETRVTLASPTAPMTQNISENTVTEILWDLTDAPVPDDDPVAGSPGPVMSVERLYFRNASTDRGVRGIDLVDFLDGYLKLNGTGATTCSGLRAVVSSRSFPYDFAGPAPCP